MFKLLMMGSHFLKNIFKKYFYLVEGLAEREDNHIPQNNYKRMF